MRKKIYAILPAIAIIVSIAGCKRELNLSKPPISSVASTEKLKTWFQKQSGSIKSRVNDSPEWESTKFNIEKRIYVTQVKILGFETKKNNNTVSKLLLTKENSIGEIISGNYVYIIEIISMMKV